MLNENLNGEILNEEQLDEVAGGTVTELRELIDAMTKNSNTVNITGKFVSHVPMANEVIKMAVENQLSEMGINADISIGIGGTGLFSKNNVYKNKRTGKTMTHAQVLKKIGNYYQFS